MKRSMVVLALALSLAAAPFARAADDAGRPGPGRRDGAYGLGFEGEQPRGPRDPGRNPSEDDAGVRRGPAQAVARLVILAVTAPWAKDDAELQRLVDETVRDCKALHAAQGEKIRAFEALLSGLREGKTREDLEAEIEALKAAGEKAREAAERLREDVRAIRERMRELRPERGEGPGPRPRRGGNRDAYEDLPPFVD